MVEIRIDDHVFGRDDLVVGGELCRWRAHIIEKGGCHEHIRRYPGSEMLNVDVAEDLENFLLSGMGGVETFVTESVYRYIASYLSTILRAFCGFWSAFLSLTA